MAQKKYDPGATDTEIKIGQTMPYSGPASAYGTIGKAEAAYFKMINDEGGINGRKINLISLDDGYSPPKTVEMVRRLVEQDEVLLVFQPLGTPPNTAIHKYMNAKKVPQLFVATGATKWNDPQDNPWTMGWQPNYQTETTIYAKHILKNKPNAKIGVLYQNDDYGKDYLKGLKDGLGDKAQDDRRRGVLRGQRSDRRFADRAAAGLGRRRVRQHHDAEVRRAGDPQGLRHRLEAGALPEQRLGRGGLGADPGRAREVGRPDHDRSTSRTRPTRNGRTTPAMHGMDALHEEVLPGRQPDDASNVYGYTVAQTLVQVLKQCGDNLTRENVMKQAASLKDFAPDTCCPASRSTPAPNDFAPIEAVQLARFDGKSWVRFGEVINADVK